MPVATTLYVLEQHELVYRDGAVMACVRKLDLVDDALFWYVQGVSVWHSLKDFDVVLMRKDPPFDMEYVYSTYAIKREAAARGHALYAMQQDDLACHRNAVTGNASRLHLTGENTGWYRLDPAEETPLERFDAVLMRKDPPFDMEYVYSTYLLEIAERRGARVFNRPQAIRDYNEKMAIARFAEFTAPTLVTRRTALLHGFLDQALMLRGSRDFASREAYVAFLRDLLAERNAGRRQRMEEELRVLKQLPRRRLESCRRERVRVDSGSLIRIDHNTYSVDSRLIGEQVAGDVSSA